MSFLNIFLHKIKVLPLVIDSCLPPLLPATEDDDGDVRGLTTTTVDAQISPMLNSLITWETSPPPPSLGILRGVPPSRRGGRRRRRRRRLCCHLRLVVATPHVVPPPSLVLLGLCYLLSADASPPI